MSKYIQAVMALAIGWCISAGAIDPPETFQTSKLGSVLRIDLETQNIQVLAERAGNLEGIAKAGDLYYITDWASGKFLKVDAEDGQVQTFMTGLRNPTDPGYAPELGLLAFPQHTGDPVLFVRVGDPAPAHGATARE